MTPSLFLLHLGAVAPMMIFSIIIFTIRELNAFVNLCLTSSRYW